MNPQYEILSKCLLPTHMLDWFELTNVEVKPTESKKDNPEQENTVPIPNVIHRYLDKNDQTPDNREGLRPKHFTPTKTFHKFPIRGQEVLPHVRHCHWFDADGHNVMSEFGFIQESTRCSKELTDLKEALGNATYNRPFV